MTLLHQCSCTYLTWLDDIASYPMYHFCVYEHRRVVSKYDESEEHMNIYEVPLTIKVNPMWYFISGMLIRGKIFTKFLLNSINNEFKRLFNSNKCLTSRKKSIINEIKRLFTLNKNLNTCKKLIIVITF